MKKGFTLIELLVVISIIGILAGLTLTGFGAARKNARDTTRKSDLGQYKTALEAYSANNNGKYPGSGDCGGGTCTGNSISDTGIFLGATGSPIVDEYLPTHIEDPTNTSPYRYRYWQSSDKLSYKLVATLETGGFWVVCSIGKAGAFVPTAPATDVTQSATCDLP